MSRFSKREFWRLSVALILTASCGLISIVFWLNWQMAAAKEFVEDQQWKDASRILKRYLKYRPVDAEARLLLARCLLSDNSRPIKTVADEALEYLAAIPKTANESSMARVIEGRIYLLLLLKPAQAEACFHASIDSDANRIDARILLWKLYDLTGRWHLCDQPFWEIYDRWTARDRAGLLRDWYMSEFNPGSAISALDRQMGILQGDEQPSAAIERRRYETFIATEPNSPLGYACLARWFHQHGMTIEGLEVIKEGIEKDGGNEDPFVIATFVALSFERGDFDGAQERFRHWPVSDRDYEYWRTKGLICDQILRQNEEAREAYEHAISCPAGQSDWLTRHRLAQVLMRMGLMVEAAEMRNRSKELELQMETNIQIPLREALTHLESLETQDLMANYYERIGRLRESRAWRDLATNPLGQTPNSTAGTP